MTFSQRLKNYVILLLFIGYLLALPCSAFAMEQTTSKTGTVAVSYQQLMLLRDKLNQLENINEQLAARSAKLKQELAMCQIELGKAKQESETLKTQLATLKQQSKSNEELLESANRSLEKFSKETKSKLATAKTQRDLAYLVAVGVILYSAKN